MLFRLRKRISNGREFSSCYCNNIFAVIIIIKGVKIVPQSDLFLVERLGKYHKVLHGGFHIIIPIIDSVRAVLTSREQLVDIEKQSVITKIM